VPESLSNDALRTALGALASEMMVDMALGENESAD
jgi:glycine cleavage system regulatory protein